MGRTESIESAPDVPSYFAYWGKAQPATDQAVPHHLLAFHSLDVAAVGRHLLDPEQRLCQRLAKQLQVDPLWLRQFFTFCLMLHDLGKFARAFQNLKRSMSTSLVQYHGQCVYTERHDTLGYLLWKQYLIKNFGDIFSAPRKIEPWLEVVCGHHGTPPKNSARWKSHFLSEDEQAAEAFVRAIAKHFPPDLAPLEQIEKAAFRAASWQIAGVTVLADWLGSNQAIFPYREHPMDLMEYWQDCAIPQGAKALDIAQLTPPKASGFRSIQQQFPTISRPTPLQDYVAQVELADGPQMFLLEDVTGAGKTEAAMVLCQRLMSEGQATGVYVALPTMATANSMYERLAQSYRALFADDTLPSLVLAHGARELSDAFTASIAPSDAFTNSVALSDQPPDSNYDADEQSASAYCNAWLADNRKKALLADVGVGTIDQALLAILPAQHQSLRLFGLSDKVLLVDEVHAYDSYVRTLLTKLLEAHARQGGSAILLSATLPQDLRTTLVNSFARGLDCEPLDTSKNAYPLVTQWSASGLQETPVATREKTGRRVLVERLDSEERALEKVRLAVQAGECICWIRNTVGDARKTFDLLKEKEWMPAEKLTLFHSRFAMIDRQAIEHDVLTRFGKRSSITQRQGQVLIATQVVEQSLDLDFDAMISDLAPIDLLIQRAGRLQRHKRDAQGRIQTGQPDARPEPCLCVLAPDWRIVENADWLKSLLPGTEAVYRHVGQLWLTLHALFKRSSFSMPDDARELIEAVYSEAAEELIPEPLREASARAEGERKSASGMGTLNRLRLEKGYTWNSAAGSGGWVKEIHTPTRLSDESIDVVLARVEEGDLQPYANVENRAHAWALSRLALREKEWWKVKERIPEPLEAKISELKEQQRSLRWLEVLPLSGDLASCYSAKDGWAAGEIPA